jgi:hypothetical protein
LFRRIAPALGLFFLAPLVAEFLLGNVAIDALPVGLVMAPMYGGGAVLIRESARRNGKGWPTMFLLALAYALIEEGLVCQTLFNPSYFGFDLLREAYIPTLGMGAWWTLFVLALHTVWSISVPIAIIESVVPERTTTPWLGRLGLAIVSALYIVGSILIFLGTYRQEHFIASPRQMFGVIMCVVVLVLVAFNLPQRIKRNDLKVPGPWAVGAFALAAASSFLGARYILSDWPIVFAYVLLFSLVAMTVVRWSARIGWSVLHRLALAGGALLAYAWHSFPEKPVIGSRGTVDLVGNVVFSIAAVVLLVVASRIANRAHDSPADGNGESIII